MRKKSLAEELAELANPAPTKEHDPEADVFGEAARVDTSDDELDAAPAKRKAKERGRLQGDIVMEGEAYAGKASSRKAVFGLSDEDDASAEDGSDGESSDDEGAEAGASDEELMDAASPGNGNGLGHASDQEDSSEDEDAPAGQLATGVDDDEMAALEREYEAVQSAELQAVAGLRERAAKERSKALAVTAQREVWRRGLEARIMLQRALRGADRLPRGVTHAVACEVDADIAGGLTGLARDAAGLLGDMLSLFDALESQHPAVGEVAAAAGVKRRREALGGEEDEEEEDEAGAASDRLWARLDDAYSGFAPFRDASIDRWHRKTVLTTGGGGRSGLKALNQSVSTQVAMVMRDSERVVQRTRLPKRQCTVLCALEEEAKAASGAIIADTPDGDVINGPDHPDETADERDPETYDDTEFYQTLLKEFLEGDQASGTGSWYSGPKHRKAVDRRASKGRKLRYHIHDKLVNFVTPVELQAPQFASNIFANLFGGAGSQRRS